MVHIQGFDSHKHFNEAIDDLNEVIENKRNDTFVRTVDFTADQTVGGAGLTTTLTIVTEGNANRYTIDWGDGDVTTATPDSTSITHTIMLITQEVPMMLKLQHLTIKVAAVVQQSQN